MARTPEFIETSTFVPVKGAKVEKIRGVKVILADVMYIGPVKDQSKLVQLEAELAELRRNSTPHTRSTVEYRLQLDRIQSKICSLPRVEIWRREYKILSR